MLFFLFSLALASGPPVTIDDPTLCDPYGYLPGLDFGEDCCTFVVCDNARLNKTGFIGKCMGGTAWNQDLLICDDPKYVTACDVTTCTVPKRTNAPCAGGDNSASSCCAGVRHDADGNIIDEGYGPVFYAGSDAQRYRIGDPANPVEAKCPLGQTFVFEDCCCEEDYIPIAPCDDTTSFYFANIDDPCCSYIQCWVNRTGFDVVACMPPSVWNDANKTCDIEQKVMACMGEGAACGQEMTDPPCQSPPAEGTCCRAGRGYDPVDGDADGIQYQVVGDDRIQCCPLDMNSAQMVFNFAEDVCCCEVPTF